jgi:exoribonuclease R
MPRMTLTPEEERENLEHSIALANDYSEAAELYKDGVPKTRVFSPETPVQFRRMLRALEEWDKSGSRNIHDLKLSREDRAGLSKYTKQISMGVNPNGTYFVRDFASPWNEALYQFVRLLNNSQRVYLDGPCLNRKKHGDRDHWYLKKTKRRTVFCTPPCAGDATQARRRERGYERKIAKASAAIRNYPKRPARFSKLSWQEYVIKAEDSISKKFLTMAVKSGRLTPPKSATGAGFEKSSK